MREGCTIFTSNAALAYIDLPIHRLPLTGLNYFVFTGLNAQKRVSTSSIEHHSAVPIIRTLKALNIIILKQLSSVFVTISRSSRNIIGGWFQVGCSQYSCLDNETSFPLDVILPMKWYISDVNDNFDLKVTGELVTYDEDGHWVWRLWLGLQPPISEDTRIYSSSNSRAI